MDFPRNPVVPTHIHSYMNAGGGRAFRLVAGATTAVSFLTWTANVAVYLPFYLPWPYDVRRAFWINGSSPAGNSDIGIYSPGGGQVWHSGATVNSGSSNAPQYVTPSTDVLLAPGWHFVAYSASTSTQNEGQTLGGIYGRMMGIYQQSSAFPLPAEASFGQYAGVGYPLVGITNTASGF